MAVVFKEGLFEGGFVAGLERPEVALHQDGDALKRVVELSLIHISEPTRH